MQAKIIAANVALLVAAFGTLFVTPCVPVSARTGRHVYRHAYKSAPRRLRFGMKICL